jgi:hypothetical protein
VLSFYEKEKKAGERSEHAWKQSRTEQKQKLVTWKYAAGTSPPLHPRKASFGASHSPTSYWCRARCATAARRRGRLPRRENRHDRAPWKCVSATGVERVCQQRGDSLEGRSYVLPLGVGCGAGLADLRRRRWLEELGIVVRVRGPARLLVGTGHQCCGR